MWQLFKLSTIFKFKQKKKIVSTELIWGGTVIKQRQNDKIYILDHVYQKTCDQKTVNIISRPLRSWLTVILRFFLMFLFFKGVSPHTVDEIPKFVQKNIRNLVSVLDRPSFWHWKPCFDRTLIYCLCKKAISFLDKIMQL